MSSSPRTLLWCLPAVLSLATAAQAAPATGPLARARAAYEAGDFKGCRDALSRLLQGPPLERAELREARLYLAASDFYLNDREAARKQLEELFRQDPFARVDPVVFPPEIVELSDEALRQVEAEGANRPAQTAPPPARAEVPVPAAIGPSESASAGGKEEVTRAPPALAVAFVPFGVGQFGNDQYVKGAAFLGLEAAALAVFVPSAILAESLKTAGIPFVNYQVPDDKLGAFRRYETCYVASFWVGVGVYSLGVVDALLNRSSRSEPTTAGLSGRRARLTPNGLLVRW